MKFQNILRAHVVVVGFAAAFLLAGGARAQEIDNTVWADSSNVEAFPQGGTAVVAEDLNILPANSVYTNSAAISQPSMDEEALGSGGAAREAWLISMSMLLMAPLGVLVVGKVRRGKRSVNSREYHSKKNAALS
jgi:hypothetical protein